MWCWGPDRKFGKRGKVVTECVIKRTTWFGAGVLTEGLETEERLLLSV